MNVKPQRREHRDRARSLRVLVGLILVAGGARSARASDPPPFSLAASVASQPGAGLTVAPMPPHPARATPTFASPTAGEPATPAAPSTRAVVIATGDVPAPPSDHDAVVGRWGLEARRWTTARRPLLLRPDRGCPAGAAGTASCTVELGALGVRYWRTRNLAVNGGFALALGGGSEEGRTLDTYVGGGPVVGMTLLLANWKHLAVGASPELAVVVFKPGGGTTKSTTLVDLRAVIEGELHFGFIDVPALSIGLAAGLGFHYESTPTMKLWSIGVAGGNSPWGALSSLFIRYYL